MHQPNLFASAPMKGPDHQLVEQCFSIRMPGGTHIGFIGFDSNPDGSNTAERFDAFLPSCGEHLIECHGGRPIPAPFISLITICGGEFLPRMISRTVHFHNRTCESQCRVVGMDSHSIS